MSVIIEVRNPRDLTSTYSQVEIQRAESNSAGSMATIKSDLDISIAEASDLSTGYTSYEDPTGDIDLHFYRFRYKNTAGTVLSGWSDIFQAGGNTLFTRFRSIMKDKNSNNYFFNQDELEFFLDQAIARLWPITWFETYSDTAFVPNSSTKIFTFPIGVTRVTYLDFLDSDGVNLGRLSSWKVRNKMILFDEAPPSNITIRAWVEKMFTKLAEVPEVWDSHLLNIMRLHAYETMEADRARFYKYNSIAKPEGGNLPSLDRIITRIEAQIQNRERQLKRTRAPANIKLV